MIDFSVLRLSAVSWVRTHRVELDQDEDLTSSAEGCETLFWLSVSFLSQQFVPFRDYMDRTGNHVLSMARLAKDVLAEIPDQLISYMKSRGIKPNPVPPAYSTGTQPPSNPVWAGKGGGGGRQIPDVWQPFKGPFTNLNPAKSTDAETPRWFWRGCRPASPSEGGQGVKDTFRCLLSNLLSKMVMWWIASKPVERAQSKAYIY